MTVTFRKDEINIREKLSELDKDTGLAGARMLAADTPQEQFELINAGRKNLIINGGFDVWQRGTTFANIPTTNYSVDRWKTFTANGAVTVTKENDEFYNYAKWDITTLPTSDYVQPSQPIEKGITPNTTYAVSFLAKGNGSVRDVEFRQSGSTSTFVYQYRPLSSGWEKYTFIVTTASDFDKDLPVSVILHLNQETSVFEMTQFQVERGNVATPFEHRSYGEELALCQRYTYVLNQTTDRHNFVGTNYTASDVYYKAQFPVVMRTNPAGTSTMTVNAYSAGTTIASGVTVTVNNTSTLTSQLTNSITGTAGYVSHIDVQGGQIIFDAEL